MSVLINITNLLKTTRGLGDPLPPRFPPLSEPEGRRKAPLGLGRAGGPRRRSPLTLPDDLLEGLPLQPVPPPQLRRDVPLPRGETGGAQPRRHLRGAAGRGSGGERHPGRGPRRAAEGKRRRPGVPGGAGRPVPGPRRDERSGEKCPLRAGARPARPAAASPRPPWRCGRALSAALALRGAPQWRQRLPRRCLAAPSHLPPAPLAPPTLVPALGTAAQGRGASAGSRWSRPPPPAVQVGRHPAEGRGPCAAPFCTAPGSASEHYRHLESGKLRHPARAAILRGVSAPLQRRMRRSAVSLPAAAVAVAVAVGGLLSVGAGG